MISKYCPCQQPSGVGRKQWALTVSNGEGYSAASENDSCGVDMATQGTCF